LLCRVSGRAAAAAAAEGLSGLTGLFPGLLALATNPRAWIVGWYTAAATVKEIDRLIIRIRRDIERLAGGAEQ
jgi:hypothetical protein